MFIFILKENVASAMSPSGGEGRGGREGGTAGPAAPRGTSPKYQNTEPDGGLAAEG